MGLCSSTSTEWLFVRWNLDQIRIWKCWFLRRGENRSSRGKTGVAGGKPEKPGENRSSRGKTSRSREENQNKLNPHMASSPGIDPEPHRWQASALTTAPYLLPNANQNILLPNWSVSFRSHYIKNWAQQLPTHTITLKILDPATFHLPTQRAQFVSSSFKVYCFPVPFLKKKIAVTINSLKSHKVKRRHSTPLNHSFPLLEYLVKLIY